MKVTLNNFQILQGEHIFDFPAGINVIVGPNASGKSSLFYAIENCLTNPNGVSDCINYNSKETSVTIEDNGQSVTWIRTPDSSCYINNNTGYKAVKASKLDSRDIADLGFYFDNKNRVMNIHNEWSVLFPFGESDSDMFRLFEDIFNISSSFQILDEIKKDEQNVKNALNEINDQKETTTTKLKTLKEIKEKVNLEDLNSITNTLETILIQLSNVRKDYEDYSKNALLRCVVLPEAFDTTTLYEIQFLYETLLKEFNYYINNKKKSEVVIPEIDMNILNNIQPIDTLKLDYEQYCLTKGNIQEYKSQLDQLTATEKSLNSELESIKVCPTCGRRL